MPALSSGATTTPGDALGLNAAGQSLGMDAFDQDLNFDDALLDSVNGGLPPLPFTPSYDFENFNTFEDPFSYSAPRPYEAAPDAEPFNEESPSQELDNKLLGFSAPIAKGPVVDEAGQFAEVGMSAELYGMFFVAEDVFGGENSGRPLELTCYRRNLWQCSGQITLPRHIAHVLNEQGRQVPVAELAASITAIESIEGKTTEIISIPWKSSNPNVANGGEETKVASAPPNVPLDLASGQELDNNLISVPVSWKRLQFKHATANNGRRKGLQQHYVVQINLLGKSKAGEFFKIAEIQSGPVIVRGRSPRNFDSRKDVPLTGDKKMERRSTSTSEASAAPQNHNQNQNHTPNHKSDRGDLAQNMQRYHSLGNIQQPGDWAQVYGQQSPHPSKKLAMSPSLTRPPVPAWSSESSIGSNKPVPATPRSNSTTQRPVPMTLPINLSLSEDERSPNRSNSDTTSPQFAKAMPASGGGQNANGSPLESADMLYEYFPLSLDDWMPPVDAVYRPHVVHHTIVPPEIKAQQVRSKTKRYFAAE